MTNLRRQRLTLALLVSLLLHLTLIGVPGWRVPSLDDLLRADVPPQLEARLVAPPAAIAPAPVRPAPVVHRPAPHRTVAAPKVIAMPHSDDTDDTPPTSVDAPPVAQPDPVKAAPAPAAMPATPAAVPAPALAPPAPKLPRRGSIRFAVSKGDQNFVIGQSLHRWSHDDKTYSLSSVTETTGIAALFRPARVTQTSEGEIGADGLRPHVFRNEKNGVAGDTASFDWAGMKLTLSGGAEHEVRLMTGAQDMLSMFYQISARYPWVPSGTSEIMIATGRKFERYAFKVLGEEKLSTKFGELRVLHLRTEGEGSEAIDIWLALKFQDLPVKIRYTDREGETFDQKAEDLEYEGMPASTTRH